MMAGFINYKDFEKFKASLFTKQPRLSSKSPEEIEQEMARVVAGYKKING